MKLFEISNYLDTRVPLDFQESYDNCGLLVGNSDALVKSILVCLDCTEEVLDEAIEKNHNLIISHHPLIFKGLKKIVGSNYIEKAIQKAIKNDIAIYAMHTNLDNIHGGVSFEIAKKISLQHVSTLKPKKNLLNKLTVYCPPSHTNLVKNALFDNGAGRVGEVYDRCSFVSSGTGSFRPLKGANPFSGEIGKDSLSKEDKIEVVFGSHLKSKILSALNKTHPYQEVAYFIDDVKNTSQTGSGVIGELKKTMSLENFLAHVKNTMNTNVIRYTSSHNHDAIKRVAVCGGSGRFLLSDAIKNKADVFITSDFKYHDFLDAKDHISILDIGHYESEYFTQHLIFNVLKEKFSKLAIHLTTKCTNPILYY
tara:strand:+ start:344 stop:1441 length:1098 start_codon:yes stop_codon:yes gene_type:complete